VSSNLGSVGQRKPGHRRPFALVDEATQPLDELVETGPARRRTPRGAPAPSSRDHARCRGQAWRRFDAYRRVHEVGTVGEQRSRARPHAGAASVRPACPVETPHGGGTRTLPSWRPPQQRSGRAQHHGSLRRADPHRRDRRCDSVPRGTQRQAVQQPRELAHLLKVSGVMDSHRESRAVMVPLDISRDNGRAPTSSARWARKSPAEGSHSGPACAQTPLPDHLSPANMEWDGVRHGGHVRAHRRRSFDHL
jgi:hypothetical protein